MRVFAKHKVIAQELLTFKEFLNYDASAYPLDVQTALAYLHEHLFDDMLSVSGMLEDCNLRSHNLHSRFKRHLTLGPREYIEDKRLMAAMHLLWHDNLEIYRIAIAVGYAHHESFTRAFKRWVGCSPSAFRLRTALYRRRVGLEERDPQKPSARARGTNPHPTRRSAWNTSPPHH